jgi:transposase InsO family protein
MDRVHMDLTGELPITAAGNKYLLVIKDAKTKFVWVYPIANKRAETVVQIFLGSFVGTFGTPKLVITDKGTEFKNKLMDEVCNLLGIAKINTTPSNPRSNGSVEKHNATMKDMLSYYVNVRHDDWDLHINHVTSLYNSTVSSSTGYTPFYVMFGRENPRVDDIQINVNLENNDGEIETYVEKMVESLSLAWEVTSLREHVNATRESTKMNKKKKLLDYFIQLTAEDMANYVRNAALLRNHLKDRAFREYQIGDRFFRKRHPVRAFKSAGEKESYKIALKLQPRYDGPYVILEKLSAVLYTANINGEVIKIHAVNMKPECATHGDNRLEEFLPRRIRGLKRSQVLVPEQTLDGGTTGNKRSLSPENFGFDKLEIIEDVPRRDSEVVMIERKEDEDEIESRNISRVNGVRKYRNVQNLERSKIMIEFDIDGFNTLITRRLVNCSAITNLSEFEVHGSNIWKAWESEDSD